MARPPRARAKRNSFISYRRLLLQNGEKMPNQAVGYTAYWVNLDVRAEICSEHRDSIVTRTEVMARCLRVLKRLMQTTVTE